MPKRKRNDCLQAHGGRNTAIFNFFFFFYSQGAENTAIFNFFFFFNFWGTMSPFYFSGKRRREAPKRMGRPRSTLAYNRGPEIFSSVSGRNMPQQKYQSCTLAYFLVFEAWRRARAWFWGAREARSRTFGGQIFSNVHDFSLFWARRSAQGWFWGAREARSRTFEARRSARVWFRAQEKHARVQFACLCIRASVRSRRATWFPRS